MNWLLCQTIFIIKSHCLIVLESRYSAPALHTIRVFNFVISYTNTYNLTNYINLEDKFMLKNIYQTGIIYRFNLEHSYLI